MEKSNNINTHTQNHLPFHNHNHNYPYLPNIQNRKLSIPADELNSIPLKKTKNGFHHGTTEPTNTDTCKQIQPQTKQSIFSIPKDTVYFKKRLSIAPKEVEKEKLYSTLESEMVKKKIEQLRRCSRQGFMDDVDPEMFSYMMKQLGEQKETAHNLSKFNNKVFLSNKKRTKEKQKDKLKPITSESNIKNETIEFINIYKMGFNTLQNNSKRSCGLFVKSILNKESNNREKPNSIRNDGKEENKRIKRKTLSMDCSKINNSYQNDEHSKNNNVDFLYIKTFQRKIQNQKVYINEVVNHNQMKETRNQLISQSKTSKIDQFQQHRESQQVQKDIVILEQQKAQKEKKTMVKRYNKKFIPPFQTYYYRDFLWKVNFSNQLFVETPLEYEHRLKIFVGKGNNSCMVSGLIARRTWFAFTDKLEEANFVWTQLKKLEYYKKQSTFKEELNIQRNEQNQYQNEKISTQSDALKYKNYFKTYFISEENCDERLLPRTKFLKYRKIIRQNEIKDQRMQNHLINNYVIGNKKALFNTMSNYYQQIKEDVFSYLPLTFHIKDGLQDKKYYEFLKYYLKRSKEIGKNSQEKGKKEYNAWIIKPGENSNRGNGIKMCLKLDQIKQILKKREKYADGNFRTYIIQAYIERPLLYCKRKFDLRHYIMMTSINGLIKGYWYKYGYVRTTSTEYTLSSNVGSIHLTNDAVQKNLPEYGKYEKGNKISYDDLSAYIQKHHNKKGKGFYDSIYPKMKKMAADSMRACSGGIDPDKLQNNFEIFGMDFMIDSNLDVWLIEINTNPCLELSCPLLGSIIPKMVQNALELTLDVMYPPPAKYCPKGLHYYKQLQKQNRFQLVFDQRVEDLCNASLKVLDNKLLQQEDDTFEDCGQDWQDS